MALPDKSVKMGLKEEEIMLLLFKEDLRGFLHGDAFDGSEEETKIFQGTFCKNGVGYLSEPDSTPGTEKLGRAVQCRIVESFGQGYLSSYSIHCLLPGSRLVSQDKIGKPLAPTVITSETEPDAVNLTSQLGFVSQDKSPTVPVASAVPSSQMEPETVSQTNQREVVNEGSTVPVTISSPISQVELGNMIQTQQRELISEDKNGAPPSSEINSNAMIQTDERTQGRPSSPRMELKAVNQSDQRDIASQGRSSTIPVSIPTIPPSSQVDQRGEPSTSLCSCALDLSKIENLSLKCLCTHLRAHANRLLADYGYKLELRRRKIDPERFKYLYRLPDGGLSHLPKTWVSLGKLLQSSPTGSDLEKTHLLGRQWVDVDEFASDLKSTLTYVEKMLQDPNCVLTLSDQWFLLDPFMAVAWIDHKLGALKKGVPLKVVQSATSVLDENEMMVLKRNDGANTLTYSRRRCKKSLLPHLALGTDLEKKNDSANMPMVEGPVISIRGETTLSDAKGIVSPVTTDLQNCTLTTGGEVQRQSASGLHASPVTTGKGAPCTADFNASPVKVGEVPITNGEEALHTADISVTPATVEKELQCPADLHVNPVRIGDEMPLTRDSCGNPVTLPNIPVMETLTVNQTSQSRIQSSIISTLEEIPFSTVNQVAVYDNIPIGAKFTINHVSESTVPQQPILILYPSNIPFPFDKIDSHCQRSSCEIDPPIYEASSFQGIISFDASSGFQIQESAIAGAVYKPLESISKRKHKTISDTKESKPRKRPKKNEDKSALDTKSGTRNRKRQGRKQVCRFHDNDLLVSAIITKKSLKYKKNPVKAPKQKPIHSKHSDQTVQLGQTYSNNKKRFTQGARTVLRLLINTGMVSVNTKIQYRNSRGKKVKEGKLTRHGVLCQCCGDSFTMSAFQTHAGSKSWNKGLNLFLGSGKPYVMCLFKAWSVEYKGRRKALRVRDTDIERNNDMCGLCGDGGQLVCCDGCPFSYHESCLPSQVTMWRWWSARVLVW